MINGFILWYNINMTKRTAKAYEKKNPKEAKLIKIAVKQGLKQYDETFKRLASI